MPIFLLLAPVVLTGVIVIGLHFFRAFRTGTGGGDGEREARDGLNTLSLLIYCGIAATAFYLEGLEAMLICLSALIGLAALLAVILTIYQHACRVAARQSVLGTDLIGVALGTPFWRRLVNNFWRLLVGLPVAIIAHASP